MRTTASAEKEETKHQEIFYFMMLFIWHRLLLKRHEEKTVAGSRSARRFIVNAWYKIWEMSQECQTPQDLIVLSFLCCFNVAFDFLLKHWGTSRHLRRRFYKKIHIKSRPRHVSSRE